MCVVPPRRPSEGKLPSLNSSVLLSGAAVSQVKCFIFSGFMFPPTPATVPVAVFSLSFSTMLCLPGSGFCPESWEWIAGEKYPFKRSSRGAFYDCWSGF